MSSDFCVWATVDPETPWQEWWSEIRTQFRWNEELVVEKWSSQDVKWSHILDSVNSFSLFRQFKAIVIYDAEKALKGEKDVKSIVERFKKGPHRVILQSTTTAPSGLSLKSWSPSKRDEPALDDKAAFRWIDAIHSENLTAGITALDAAIGAGQHSMALLQLVTRDFRIGRLIHHAHQSRIKEAEMLSYLKIPSFVIGKWIKRPQLPKAQWAGIFDRLLSADLELKSGADEIWVLRKLTFDLVQITTHPMKINTNKKLRKLSKPAQLPWTSAPSFA